jgi:ComF family protein
MKILVDILLPRSCGACDRILRPWEEEICLLCLMEMPVSYYHENPDNPVAQVFWGRVRIHQASTWFVYVRGSRFGNLLHRLKYEHRPLIGTTMGKLYGFQLLDCKTYEKPDVIIPVPLHPKRKRKRGYNQSEQIAKGLSKAMGIPCASNILIRNVNTRTQTAKSRVDRYLNVHGKFSLIGANQLVGKHVLLVDDVITTGATMEACAEVLLDIEQVKVSIAGIAFADKRG